jgi:hypothetical protein
MVLKKVAHFLGLKIGFHSQFAKFRFLDFCKGLFFHDYLILKYAVKLVA